MVLLKFLLAISVLAVGCYGHSLKMGGCPKIKVMKDFSMQKFVGEWFIIGRFNPMTSCAEIFIDKKDDVVTVEENSRPLGFNFGLNHFNRRRPKKLYFPNNETESIFQISHQFKPFGMNTYGVLDTDYETFAVLWGCDPVLIGSVQSLDILSRTEDTDMNYEIFQRAKEMAEKKGIDTSPLAKVEQASCSSRRKDGPNMVAALDHGMEVES